QRSTDTGCCQVSVHKGYYDTQQGKVVFPNRIGTTTFPAIVTNFTALYSADKPHIGVDKSNSNGYVYVSYTNFSVPGNGQIEVVRSTDGGATWSTPVILAAAGDTPHSGSVPRIGPQGQVYVAWEDGRPTPTRSIQISKSTNWPNFSAPIKVDNVTRAANP